jgi:hypothetical protein
LGDEFFETFAMMRDCGCQAEIRINDLDILITPAETERGRGLENGEVW